MNVPLCRKGIRLPAEKGMVNVFGNPFLNIETGQHIYHFSNVSRKMNSPQIFFEWSGFARSLNTCVPERDGMPGIIHHFQDNVSVG